MPAFKAGMKTIRGTLQTADDDGAVTEKLIFNYESPDRTRGWIVEGAWLWLADQETTVASGGAFALLGNLATDSYTKTNKTILDPDDNRSIGWYSKQYVSQNGTANDFNFPNAVTLSQSTFLLDLERIITNDLFISACTVAGQSQTGPFNVGYMIVLREVNLSAGQSLLQQLKGIGQNVDN